MKHDVELNDAQKRQLAEDVWERYLGPVIVIGTITALSVGVAAGSVYLWEWIFG